MKVRPVVHVNHAALGTVTHSPLPGGAEAVNVVQHIPEIILADNPGIFLTGAPGSGKSNALEILLHETALSPLDLGCLYIDPHGTGAAKFRRWCLDQGPRVAARVLYLHFAAAARNGKLPSINVLHLPGDDIGSPAWYGRLTAITELNGKILLNSWGETDFNSKPILFKNVFRIIYTLAHAGLPLADARLFLDVSDQNPLYRTLCQAVPDLIARHEMEELPELRPSDRLAQLESCKNRFLGFLSNPIVEAVLGRVDGALTMEQMYDERLIVIVNLETGGVLRTMDQEILANVLLSLAIYTAMNTPE